MIGLAGFLLGLVLGSFIKVLADRSLSKQSFWGRSYCTYCKKTIKWYDLFPVISYILLKARCKNCHKKLSIEYLLMEVATGLLIGFLFYQTSVNLQSIYNFKFLSFLFDLIFKTFFVTILSVVFLTDIKKMFIPDRIILPAIRIGITFITAITIIKVLYLYYYLNQTVVGKLLLPPHSDFFLRHAFYTAEPFLTGILMAALIGGFFMSLIIITKGKGMGGGDVKLGAFIGLMLGFPNSLIAIFLSFLTGAVFSIFLIIFGKKHFGQSIPFGPFLVLGSLMVLFWGDKILNWYLSLRI